MNKEGAPCPNGEHFGPMTVRLVLRTRVEIDVLWNVYIPAEAEGLGARQNRLLTKKNNKNDTPGVQTYIHGRPNATVVSRFFVFCALVKFATCVSTACRKSAFIGALPE